VDIHYKYIGYVEMKGMFGLSMVMAMAKDLEIDDALIAEAKEMTKELAGSLIFLSILRCFVV